MGFGRSKKRPPVVPPVPPAPPLEWMTIEVRAYDLHTQRALGGAEVSIAGGETRHTNGEGTAHFDVPRGRQVDVTAKLPGYDDNTASLLPGEDYHLGVWLRRAAPAPGTPPSGVVKPLQGQVRAIGHSFGDGTGPRIVHGCSDFGALAKHHQDRDTSLRQLDVVAQHQQYIRVCWRLNGPMFNGGPGYLPVTVDPIRDPWFDAVWRDYLQACHDRGLRVNATSGDMNNWTMRQAEETFGRVADIAADVSPDLIWLGAVTNELIGTWDGAGHDVDGQQHERREIVEKCEHLLRVWQAHYPWGMRAISDPRTQDKAGMMRLSGPPATCALIHDVRWDIAAAIRHSFNTPFENYPGVPIVQDEPGGPNGSPPHSEFTRKVFQPIDDPNDIFSLYTTHVFTGQASTYFNDPALCSRLPLDSTWGFKELPALWRQLEIPENIGQGVLRHGGQEDGALQVNHSHAGRADACTIGGYTLGVISGDWDRPRQNWQVRAGRDGHATAWLASGPRDLGRVSHGQVLDIPGPTPTVVRIVD